jgi:RNA polymerase sigma-70 factor (ECF subfamily)
MESDELIFLADPNVRAAAMRRAMGLLRGSADAEDAVQEAAVRALRYRRSLRPGSPGAPWFLQIVARVSLDMVSRRRADVVPFPEVEPPADASSLALDVERSHLVRAAVDALPSPQRRVVLLHDRDGFTTHEIASLDGAPPSTIRTRLRRARLALRVALKEAVGA